jgi:hypothetical protein
MAQFKKAPDLPTLFRLNKQYTRGELTAHPAHNAPLYPETNSLAPASLEANEWGLGTFQGQPRTLGGNIRLPKRGGRSFFDIEEEAKEIIPGLNEEAFKREFSNQPLFDRRKEGDCPCKEEESDSDEEEDSDAEMDTNGADDDGIWLEWGQAPNPKICGYCRTCVKHPGSWEAWKAAGF